jgi:hypothetical protein
MRWKSRPIDEERSRCRRDEKTLPGYSGRAFFIKRRLPLSNGDIHPVIPVLDRREDFEKATFILGFCFFRDDFMGQLKAA